jgi:hypothetical protein
MAQLKEQIDLQKIEAKGKYKQEIGSLKHSHLKELESKGDEYKRNLEVSSISSQQQTNSLQEQLQ